MEGLAFEQGCSLEGSALPKSFFMVPADWAARATISIAQRYDEEMHREGASDSQLMKHRIIHIINRYAHVIPITSLLL